MCVAAIAKGFGMENVRYEINSIKANEDVFKTLLKKQPRYQVTKSSSQFLWIIKNSRFEGRDEFFIVTFRANENGTGYSLMQAGLFVIFGIRSLYIFNAQM